MLQAPSDRVRPAFDCKLPDTYQIRSGSFVFMSDVDLKRSESMIQELDHLHDRVLTDLHLPSSEQLVFIYLFADRSKYEAYMMKHFKDLPARRAFFVAYQDAQKGMHQCVFTFWGEQIQQDLRHELTHATLHSVLADVPMWLDEGLAEYYEVPASWNGLNYRHLEQFQAHGDQPWNPDLHRLEHICNVANMTLLDYQESWGWVHFILHDVQLKQVLIQYLAECAKLKPSVALESRLRQVSPNLEDCFRRHLIQLQLQTRDLNGPTLR